MKNKILIGLLIISIVFISGCGEWRTSKFDKLPEKMVEACSEINVPESRCSDLIYANINFKECALMCQRFNTTFLYFTEKGINLRGACLCEKDGEPVEMW